MKISVCMAVYNGEKFILEQLESLLHQTRQPDEVVLCDDGSSDGTEALVRGFLQENGLEGAWRYTVNTERKGYPGNFYHAMSLCTGDVVFLADQDDIWGEEKLELLGGLLEGKPQALAVCCKFGLIDADGGDIRTVMAPAKSRGTGSVRQIDIRDVFYKCEWPGMVMAYRREWLERRRAGREFAIPHDFLVCAWAAEENGFFQLDEILAFHRRHGGNTGGEEHRIGKLLDKERKLEEIEKYQDILEAFHDEDVLDNEEARAALAEKRRSMSGRREALISGKIGTVLGNAWKNRRETRLATLACDILIVRKRAGVGGMDPR